MLPSMRKGLAVSLACGLYLNAVVAAAGARQNPKQALGQVVRSSLATLGGIAVPSGGTVVSGDTLATPKAGGALVKFTATSQIELSEDTSVTLLGSPGHVLVRLAQGTVVAGVQGSDYLAVETAQCEAEPADPTGASYSVTFSPGASANITATRGSVSIVETTTSAHRLLAQGQSSACPGVFPVVRQEEATPAPSQSAGQAPPAPATRGGGSNTTLLLLLVGGGAAAGIGAAAAAGGHGGGGGGPASPSAP